MENRKYLILAYYYYTSIAAPEDEVKKHQKFFESLDVAGRIYISEQGINGQMSAEENDADKYMQWLKSDERFAGVDFKIHTHHEHVFPRMTVKTRKQLVALDRSADLNLTGEHVAPEKWEKMLSERDEDTLVLDVRNRYEWEIGHFEGAELPALEKFREFPAYAKRLKEERDPKKTKVMMYCTGGIRCELFSALLKEEGFENVYQLNGGVIRYGLEKQGDAWKGKLFVFDDRLSVPINPSKADEVISQCIYCKTPSDVYYNCANMDCNEMFICCQECAPKYNGCCCTACSESSRRRPFDSSKRPKPFRRYHEVLKQLASQASAPECDREQQ